MILDKNNLRNNIQNNIFENTQQLITGDILQNVLLNIADSMMSLQDDEKWSINNNNIEIKNGSLNINLKDKGLTDNNIINNNANPILLTDNNNYQLQTNNTTIIGSINELNTNVINIQNNYALKNLSNVNPNDTLNNLNNATGDITINTTLFDNFDSKYYKKFIQYETRHIRASTTNNGKWSKIFKLKYTYDNSDRYLGKIIIKGIGGNFCFGCYLEIFFYIYFNNLIIYKIKNYNWMTNKIRAIGKTNDNYIAIKVYEQDDPTGVISVQGEFAFLNNLYLLEYINSVQYNGYDVFPYTNANNNDLTDSDMDIIYNLTQFNYNGEYEYIYKNATILTNNGIPTLINGTTGQILFDTNDNQIKINFPNIGWKNVQDTIHKISDSDGNTYLTVEPVSSASNYALLKVPQSSTHVAFRIQNSNNDNIFEVDSLGTLEVKNEIKTPKLNSLSSTNNLIIGDNSNIIFLNNLTKIGGIQYDGYTDWNEWGNIRQRITVNASTNKTYSPGDYAIYNIEKNKTYLYIRNINLYDSTYSEGVFIILPRVYTYGAYREFIENVIITSWDNNKAFMEGFLKNNIDIFEYGIMQKTIINQTYYTYYIKFRIYGGNSINLNDNYAINLTNTSLPQEYKIIRKIKWNIIDVFSGSKFVSIYKENDYYVAIFNYWETPTTTVSNSINTIGQLYLLHRYNYQNNTLNWTQNIYRTLGIAHSGYYGSWPIN